MSNSNTATRIQGAIAIASFSVGALIAMICLFAIPPRGVIENSAISIVSEFLILCGALLGIKVTFDTKLRKFESEMIDKLSKE